jgi:hypothetical protein
MKYNLTVQPLQKERWWKVVKGFAYAGVEITPDFEFDGCSIPWGLRWRFKHGGAKFPAGAMHDYLYRTGKVHKERADYIFYEIMIANGVSEHDAKLMYNGVKYCGFAAWNKHRKNDK